MSFASDTSSLSCGGERKTTMKTFLSKSPISYYPHEKSWWLKVVSHAVTVHLSKTHSHHQIYCERKALFSVCNKAANVT